MKNSELSENARNPILLLTYHPLTTLNAEGAHRVNVRRATTGGPGGPDPCPFSQKHKRALCPVNVWKYVLHFAE